MYPARAMSSLVWIELEREAPDHNLRELRKGLKKGTILCAVVKANAYGHGVKQMVPLFRSADWFAVNSLEEGIELRELGDKRPILVLGHVPLADLGEAVQHSLDLTVYNRQSLEALGAPRKLVRKYAFRNAVLPQITGLALQLGVIVAGALVTEVVFSYPGIGYLLLAAIQNQDYFLIQGCFLFIIIGVLLANFAIDIVYVMVDPRTRLGMVGEAA